MKILVDHVLGDKRVPGSVERILAFLPGSDTTGGLILWVALSGLAIFAINSAVDVILTFTWIRVGYRMVYDLAGDLFARVQRRSLLFHTRSSVGDSLSRIMDDSWSVYTITNNLLFTPGHALITSAAMIVVMARLDVGLTLLSLTVAPVMAGASLPLGRPIRAAARARREIESRIQSHVQQTLSGIPVVQAFAQEEREHRRFKELTSAAVRAKQRSTLADSVYTLGGGLPTALGSAAVLWVGARHVLDGSLTVGSLLVFLSYLRSLYGPLESVMYASSTAQGAAGSARRVMEMMETEQEPADRPDARRLPPVKGHIRIESVTFGYEPDLPVLRDVSVEVRPGETIAIVGSTGAGKSTLVSLVPRFFDPWEGRVTVDGHDLRDVQLKSLRDQVALVLQEPFLFPFTVHENIAYGRPDATRAEVEAAARAANAHAFIEKLPQGYDTPLGERGATLSGGERQRISIARALLKDAPILILDEPTSALDAETENLLLEALNRLVEGRTTLIIAHRLSTIRDADRIVVMREGKVAEVGTHEELVAVGGAYAHLLQLQFREQMILANDGRR